MLFRSPAPLFSGSRGAAGWGSGLSISKRLRHFNTREVAARDDIQSKDTAAYHLPGKASAAGLLAKEIRGGAHFMALASRLASPRGLGARQIDV